MARGSIRDLLRLRTTFLAHPTPLASSYHHFSSHSDLTQKPPTIFSQALKLLDSCQNLTNLLQIHAHLIVSGIFKNPYFSGRLLKLSTQFCDDIDYIVLIFDRIKFPDTFSVNAVLKAYACSCVPWKAVFFFVKMMREGFFPNEFTFPLLISACAKTACLSSGRVCHARVVKSGVGGVLSVQNSLIHFYACCGLVDVACRVFMELSERDLVSWNSLIDGFAKVGELEIAHQLFDEMPTRNVVSWNVLITGYLSFGYPGNGLKLFRRMMKLGIRGNDTTMVNVLTACGKSARLREGKSVHGFLFRASMDLSLVSNTALIDMYCKCGRVDVARLIFDSLRTKNLVCWNAMILGHCIHGFPLDGLNLFREMCSASGLEDTRRTWRRIGKEGGRVIPNEITFIGVLCACARDGLLTEGRNYFNQMIDKFHIKPIFAHHWCMANLLANLGHVQEALELLMNIPVDENFSLESSFCARLFGLCRFQADVILGEKYAKALIERDCQNFSYYALLVNVYAVAGRWDEVSRTKQMLKERGVKRVPGCNLKDLQEIVQNSATPELREIKKKANSLTGLA